MGLNIEILPDATKETIDVGLKYVNNDACYPSLIVVGQLMSAITVGCYGIQTTAEGVQLDQFQIVTGLNIVCCLI